MPTVRAAAVLEMAHEPGLKVGTEAQDATVLQR